MSEKTARIHNHISNRAKNRQAGEKKVVFKGVLDNPFRIQWPSIPLELQNTVLANTLVLLDGIVNYQMSPKPRETQMVVADGSMTISEREGPVDRPTILQHLVVGINEVTRRLESQIRHGRLTVITTDNAAQDIPPSPLQLILVCRADINPPILVDHLPHLVAAYNSLKPQAPAKLIILPLGAELLLSRAIGLRRAAVLGIDSNWPDLDRFMVSLGSVPTLSATWLASIPLQKFVPTHIKQVRTSTPKDIRAEKQRRKEEKILKKEARRVVSGMKAVEG
ncbi:hypothetical protein FPV67DRAFT_1466795 [Lyophyllum atratum]|nr:hypothetical protein FPV67DRAFT_1466795 [Lyophyllum atratum]